MSVAVAASRRTELAQQDIARQKRSTGASVASYIAAGGLSHEGGAGGPLAGEAAAGRVALGLVYSSTSDTRVPLARVSLEIDPLRARAQRLRKTVITGARLHDEETKKGGFRGAWYFLTLTYRDGSTSGPRDISELLKRMRGFFDRANARSSKWTDQSLRYVWVGELTKSLRPHYHVMLWVPRGMFFGKVDQRGWWPHGSTQIEKARNCVGYLAKYASKFTEVIAGAFPKGFRTHGCGGLSQQSKRVVRWWKAPREARELLGDHADIRKIKGGYFDKNTGEMWPSPWKVTLLFGRIIIWKTQIL